MKEEPPLPFEGMRLQVGSANDQRVVFFQPMRSIDVFGHVQVQNSKTSATVSVPLRHPQVKQEMIP